jgi:hypothetical protein
MDAVQFLTNTHMERRSSKAAEMPRIAYLAAGIVAAAILLHSMLLPMVKQDQMAAMSRFLAILDMDQDTDGIADVFDRVNMQRFDRTMRTRR